ncbi:MAG: hypothetical protein WBK51_16625 [Polaromonas sp.]
MPKRTIIKLTAAGLLAMFYPVVVLSYTWTYVLMSNFEGGRHGPLDAYRHTLASAFVSYTTSPSVVAMISHVMENNTKRSSAMDRHNNNIGSGIGQSASKLSEIEPLVARSITNGAVNSLQIQQSTWLPKEDWRPGKLW